MFGGTEKRKLQLSGRGIKVCQESREKVGDSEGISQGEEPEMCGEYQSHESIGRRYFMWSEPRKPRSRFRVEMEWCPEPESQTSRPLEGAEQIARRSAPSPAQAPALE